MESSLNCILQIFSSSIDVLKQVPGLIWGALIAVSGVYVSNRDNTKRLVTQLDHDRAMKKAEREFNTMRDVFQGSVEAIAAALRTLPSHALLHLSGDELSRDYVAKAASLAKVQLIGSSKTIAALDAFNLHMMKATLSLSVIRAPLLHEYNELQVMEKSVAKAQRDFDDAMETIKRFAASASTDQAELNRNERMSKFTLERVNRLIGERDQFSNGLKVKAMSVFKEAVKLQAQATSLLPTLLGSMREDLGVPIDIAILTALQEESNKQMIIVSEQMETLLKGSLPNP